MTTYFNRTDLNDDVLRALGTEGLKAAQRFSQIFNDDDFNQLLVRPTWISAHRDTRIIIREKIAYIEADLCARIITTMRGFMRKLIFESQDLVRYEGGTTVNQVFNSFDSYLSLEGDEFAKIQKYLSALDMIRFLREYWVACTLAVGYPDTGFVMEWKQQWMICEQLIEQVQIALQKLDSGLILKSQEGNGKALIADQLFPFDVNESENGFVLSGFLGRFVYANQNDVTKTPVQYDDADLTAALAYVAQHAGE